MTSSTSARLFLRRALAAAGQSNFGATSAIRTTNTTTISRVHAPARRLFGASANRISDNSPAVPASEAYKYQTLVEKSIKKLMTTNHRNDAQEEQLKPISNEDLEVRLSYFQKVFKEAELCMSDLRETLFEMDDEQYLEECSCAEGALNNAFTAYIDLLEDFRRSTEEQLHAYSEERNTNANNLKRLRKKLVQIIEVANNRGLASE